MADKSGRPTPGPQFIEVEYDYEYEYKNKKVVIKQGERYILMKKSNEDWWQVRLDENSRPLYVPAQYVKEVGRKALMPPIKPGILPNSPLKLTQGLQRSMENINKSPELTSFGKTPSIRDANQNFGPGSSPGQTRGLTLDLVHNNGKLCTDLHSPKATSRSPSALHFPGPEMMEIEKTCFSNEQSDSAGENSEKILVDSESGDELSSSSTEQLQFSVSPAPVRSDSPVYANLQELKISQSNLPPQPNAAPVQITGEWETHKDSTGRFYYYNKTTQERTWKPPRCTKDSSKGESVTQSDHEQLSSEEIYHNTYENQSDSQYGSPPKGWSEELDQHGHTFFINDQTNEKNWTSSWAVLQGSSILFQGTGASWKFGSNQSKPEFTVDLKGASVEWATKDKSSKKNVIEVKTNSGTELLIQSDNDNMIKEWYTALCNTIGVPITELEETNEDNVPDSPVEKQGKDKHDKEKDHDKDSKKNRSIKQTASIDNTEQKKTKTKLKKFLIRRPTLQAVREKGYIKDPVFGSSLASLCQRENTTVPKFVKMCIEHIEEHGLDVEGLYRVSGNLAVIQKLRFAVTHDEKLDLNDSKWEDIHVITGALKMFFRELPEPLFTYNYFNDFVNAIKQEPKHRVQAVRDLIKQLPKPNQDTMQALFKHLKHVVETGEKNRMNVQSLAIVFGPTLLKPENETGNIAIHTVYQSQIVELILMEYSSIFGR
uniref:Rho GTPase-activating protein 12 n=1 Tax=Pyxicephalus adspersus TaxID=30357 RepID=A0AAV3AEY9_PYXAD|nr:TPA: hypothetical protein GDO54_012691 [Pyxicephalus adspersus]